MTVRCPALVHSADADPGIHRRRCGNGYVYLDQHGRRVKDQRQLARIHALAIPPAWNSVWICKQAKGHLQATGIDAQGRKQYLYHRDWADWRSQEKYRQLPAFGAALPSLRRRLRRDLEQPAGSLQCTLAALVLLLDRAHLRLGSRRHLQHSGTYGAATLERRHLQLGPDGVVRLRFRGKGGRRIQRSLRDRRLHRVLQEIDDLPGRNLFTWIDADGRSCPVRSQQVNAYIAEASGLDGVTAKTFRTWAGSVAALEHLRRGSSPTDIRSICKAASRRLHNTAAVCRAYYVHPAVLALAGNGSEDRPAVLSGRAPAGPCGLFADERRLLLLLENWR